MLKKTIMTLIVFIVMGGVVFGVGSMVDPDVGLPERITAETPCPAVGCANGRCHGFDDIPEPDGVSEMMCPEVSCSTVDCHAWDTFVNRYYQPSDMSLNLWILVPVALVIGLIVLVRKL